MKNVLARAIAIVVVVAAIGLSVHAVCDFFFDCGCRPVWAGAADHCNIHHHEGPQCPWCTGGNWRLIWVGALMFVGAGLGMRVGARLAKNSRAKTAIAVICGIAGYGAGAVIASLAAALVTGYPTWLGIAL